MVEDDEVARLEVEAVQAVAGAFGVVDVFIDDVGGAFGVGCDALADLPGGFIVLAACLARWLGVDCAGRCRMASGGVVAYLTGPNLPKRSNSSSVLTV